MNNCEKVMLWNGVEIPVIGYGTFPYKEELLISIPAAVDLGYRLFDSSDDYHNYPYVGEALNDVLHSKDKEIIVEGKISLPYKPTEIESMIETYRIQLQLEKRPLDVLLLHFPYPNIYVDTWREMERLYEAGICRAIGVCNFEIKHLQTLMKRTKIKPMINQFELHPFFHQSELCEYCKKNEIAIMSYSPLARMNKMLFESNILNEIANSHKKSVAQVILRWNLQHGYIPIPASASIKHIRSNIDIFDFVLSNEEMKNIDGLDSGMRIRYNPNTMFRQRTKLRLFYYHIDYWLNRLKGE